ncbi:MAG TPA: hypothetical protein VGX25_30255 [Actinophytocola sp.]|uniref:hypothetical protein n=1 Tax=Actinophytocola sp. TaxID=1872138 RepID=UPI002DDCF14B|nr:hypothetical protein [Actinophytocola sp.]HEV2783691.1 hypothetical protein [Actinophytocola sp.]
MSTGTPPPRPNPFSPTAVARVTGFEHSDASELTIETDAVREATSYLSAYLHAPPPGAGQDPAGEVIAILGEYGTGKTHLAVRLVRHARRVLHDPERAIYLDATADSFVALYRRFIDRLGLARIKRQVENYYADIVAEALEGVGLTSGVVEKPGEREPMPHEVVERLGLMESALLRKVQETLRRVTDNQHFGTALTLLLRSGFDEIVWAWLQGGEPHQVLKERGIDKPINNEVDALEAMGVLALLYGGRQARFVLVLDELDKIFSSAQQPQADTVHAFQKLLQVFASAGACLVLCALPDLRSVLYTSTRQRISHMVDMKGLTVDEIHTFIKLSQQAEFGRAELAPFTHDSIRYLRDTTGGNARYVIKLCHDAFRVVDDLIRNTRNPKIVVTPEIVREVARKQLGFLSANDIHNIVRVILDANGWSYIRDHLLADDPESRTDFWVTFQDRAGGCAIMVTGPVRDDADMAPLTRRIVTVRMAEPEGRLILIVNGILAEEHAAELRERLGVEPLVYVEPGFAEDFKARVRATSDRLPRIVGSTPLTEVQQRIDQINRQHSKIYDSIGHLATHIDGVRSSSDQRLAAIERTLNALMLASQGGAATGPARLPAAPALPREIDQLFLDAINVLDELTQLDLMMDEAYGQTDGSAMEDVQARLSAADFFEAVGVAHLMRTNVLSFRTAVTDWYRAEIVESAGHPSPRAEERLEALCRAYDDVAEFLPTFTLRPLTDMAPWTARGGADVAELSQRQRRIRVQTALDNLSPRVQRVLLRSALASGG